MISDKIKNIKKIISEEVQLIAVSKTKPVEMIQEAMLSGHLDFGENKVQEILEKHEKLPNDIRWHFIGHLQTNKVKYIIPFISLVHSVDSLKPHHIQRLSYLIFPYSKHLIDDWPVQHIF